MEFSAGHMAVVSSNVSVPLASAIPNGQNILLICLP